MLPTKRRVLKKSFAEIMKDGVFLYGNALYIKFIVRNNDLPGQFGFVVPVKVNKTSVGRHLIKRKLTAIVEKQISRAKNGAQVLFFVKKDISLTTTESIEKEILELLNKAGVLNEKRF